MSRGKRPRFGSGDADSQGTGSQATSQARSGSTATPRGWVARGEPESLLDYVNSHNILHLFEDMIGQLLKEKPDKPLCFLAQHMADASNASRRQRRSLMYTTPLIRGGSFLDGEAVFSPCAAGGADPLLPPEGMYGGVGKTAHRRSVALGLGAGWGSVVSDPTDTEEDEASEEDSNADDGKVPRAETPRTMAARLKEEVREEVQRCLGDNDAAECSLYDLRLKAVPQDALLLAHIRLLDLSNNSLCEIPAAIANLVSLETLCLRSNNLTALPTEIGLLHLETLQLEQNMLLELPDSIGGMTTLRNIGLDWNDFVEFPTCLCNIRALADVSIIENPEITTLPVDRMRCFDGLRLAVDNYPTLVKLWDAEGPALSNVTIDYNKVFPDKIIPGLFLGTLRSAQSERIYRALNITFVCSVGRELRTCQAEGVTNLKLNVDDLPGTDIVGCFERVHAAVDKAIAEGSACLVHCFKGQSRSASCVISYIIKMYRMQAVVAEAFVKSRSPRICPNPGFKAKLAQYAESILQDGEEAITPPDI